MEAGTGLAYLLGVLTSYWFLAAVIITSIFAEYNDKHKTTAVLTAVGLTSAYLMFDLSAWLLVGYIPAGLVWSFWRWRVYRKNCTALAKKGKLKVFDEHSSWKEIESPSKEQSREALIKATLLLPNVDKIISWVICFPVSMIENAIDDVIHVLKIAVVDWFGNIYRNEAAKALKEFDEDEVTINEVDVQK